MNSDLKFQLMIGGGLFVLVCGMVLFIKPSLLPSTINLMGGGGGDYCIPTTEETNPIGVELVKKLELVKPGTAYTQIEQILSAPHCQYETVEIRAHVKTFRAGYRTNDGKLLIVLSEAKEGNEQNRTYQFFNHTDEAR